MTDTFLIVPINVAALAVGLPDTQNDARNLAPMADFSRLPWSASGQSYNHGPYISEVALENGEPFQGEVPLPQGIHVHWALPDALTSGSTGAAGAPSRLRFPSAPNRWLVTRIVVSSPAAAPATTALRSWVVESDRLNDAPNAPTGLNQPNIPAAPQPGQQTFQYLGQAFDLAGWHETAAPRLKPFTAVGYGTPTFAAFYPNCSTVFGYFDTLADLTAYDPAISSITYQVAGWYSDPADDPLAYPKATPATYAWAMPNPMAPSATLCAGVVDAIAWDPKKPYLGESPKALTVAVGPSSREAAAALMAGVLKAKGTGQYDNAEQVLNALQFGMLSGSDNKVDAIVSFEEDVHAAGFATLSAGRLWTVTAAAGGDRSAQGAQMALPAALADRLNALNAAQLRLNDAGFALNSLRSQLFADWYKYQLIEHDPAHVPQALQTKQNEVRLYLQNTALAAVGTGQNAVAALSTQVDALAAALRVALPASLTLSNNIEAPRFYKPADPVLLLQGDDVQPTERYGNDNADGPLPCRTESDLVHSVTLAAGLVPGSAAFTLGADALPLLAAPPLPVLQALLAEAFFVSPGLQASVVAALAAKGGAGNPATLNAAGTLAALRSSCAAVLAGKPPSGVAFGGSAPAPRYYAAWTGTPWLPILMQYQVQFTPVQSLDPRKPGETYAPGFIDTQFAFDADSIDLSYNGPLPSTGEAYSGTAILTPHATIDLANEITQYLKHVGNDDELQAVLDSVTGLPLLSQGLSGFTEALLMHALTLQMPVGDPMTPAALTSFVAAVKDAVGSGNLMAPQPEGNFNPIRSGLLVVTKLRLIDVFGRFKDYATPTTLVAKGLEPPASMAAPAGSAFLPPRLAQAARLLFRWRAADDGNVETNDSPATTPVIGWVVPNYLDRAFDLYAPNGQPLAEMALSGDGKKVLFTPAPGGAFPLTASLATVFAGQLPDFRNFAEGLFNGGDATFLVPFFEAVRQALTFSLPSRFAETAGSAVLAGQPLALARASLALDLLGPVATDESWNGFAADVLNTGAASDGGLTQVKFPVTLGAQTRLDDTLVGYWKNPSSPADFRSFNAPYAASSSGGVSIPAQDAITLSPQGTSDSALSLILLLDPRGSVHASTGILPVKAIGIPSAQYAGALAGLQLSFSVTPVLSGTNAPATGGGTLPMQIVQPKVSSGNWSWITTDGNGWRTTTLTDSATAQATLNYTPQHISEGWLALSVETEPTK